MPNPMFSRLLALCLSLLVASPLALAREAGSEAPAARNAASQSRDRQPEPVILTVTGTRPLSLTASQLQQLPQRTIRTVTPWTEGVREFRGVLLRDLLTLADIHSERITVRALNDYFASIETADAYRYDVILATHQDGQPMSRRQKGPVWVIYPLSRHAGLNQTSYHRKMVWQVKALEAGSP